MGSDDDENIDGHGHVVIMIVMAAVTISVLLVLTFDVFEPVSGRVDHGFEYDVDVVDHDVDVVDHDLNVFEHDADVVDHDLDVFEPVSGGEDLLQHSVPLLADTPHLIVQVNNLKQGLTLYPGYPKLIIPNRGQS